MRQAKTLNAWLADERGAVTSFSFTVTFPFVIMITGLVLQYGMMASALLVTKQAAYWGGRCAAVYIPDGEHGGSGQMGGEKGEILKTAVAVALLPACIDVAQMGGAVQGYAGTSTQDLGILSSIPKFSGRLAFARAFSEVQVTGDASMDLGGSSTITVKVTFYYPLKIPFARRLLGGHIKTLWLWAPRQDIFVPGDKAGAFDQVMGMGNGDSTNQYYAKLEGDWMFFNEQRPAPPPGGALPGWMGGVFGGMLGGLLGGM